MAQCGSHFPTFRCQVSQCFFLECSFFQVPYTTPRLPTGPMVSGECFPRITRCFQRFFLTKQKQTMKNKHRPSTRLPSSKLTWQWKITTFNREYIFNWSIFHCHVSLPEGNSLDFACCSAWEKLKTYSPKWWCFMFFYPYPNAQCMVYLATCSPRATPNVDK